MSKFDNVPIDEDTKINLSIECKWDDLDVLHQHWFWDGISGESLIFVSEELLNKSDDDIEEEIRTSTLYKGEGEITISQSETGYTFVNFNFATV